MFLYLVLAITCGVTLADSSKDGRIVGGEIISIENAPHQVSLQLTGNHFCGGAIIHSEYVLTAGHCSDLPVFERKEAVVGLNRTFSASGKRHRIITIIRHPEYKVTSLGSPRNDLALMRVSPRFEYSDSVQPISLGKIEPVTGQLVTITGYGRVKEQGPLSNNLLGVSVPIVNKDYCRRMYAMYGINHINYEVFCAGLMKGGKDSCQGDSGGPVVSGNKLVGLVSFGIGCGRPKIPGVYTNLPNYLNWIISTIYNSRVYPL